MQSVLVAATDSAVRRELFRMLTCAGLDDVRVATSAAEVLDAHRATPADIVLVDVVSPPPAGTDLIRTLRFAHPTVFIIGLAAGGLGERQVPPDTIVASTFLAKARIAGANATLESPFDKREFIQLVAQFRQWRATGDGNSTVRN
jgi:CheY-like chemotaxis protein